jgi:hypothetical protein
VRPFRDQSRPATTIPPTPGTPGKVRQSSANGNWYVPCHYDWIAED